VLRVAGSAMRFKFSGDILIASGVAGRRYSVIAVVSVAVVSVALGALCRGNKRWRVFLSAVFRRQSTSKPLSNDDHPRI
jgi:hypothetical protein